VSTCNSALVGRRPVAEPGIESRRGQNKLVKAILLICTVDLFGEKNIVLEVETIRKKGLM
jgi:hypothetical protein